MSPRKGMTVWPSARSRSGSAPRAGAAGRVQRRRRAVPVVDQGEEVTAHPAQVGVGHRQDGVGGDGRVHRRAAPLEHDSPADEARWSAEQTSPDGGVHRRRCRGPGPSAAPYRCHHARVIGRLQAVLGPDAS